MQNGKVTVFRFNPEIDSEPRYETYDFPFKKGMSVLDVALYIYEQVDSTFSFSYCCRNSHCGLCGAQINGKPGLMCREGATLELRLEPLKNLTVVRDLMVNRQEYEERKSSLRLFIERVEVPEQKPEKICNADHERFKVASRCVECYSCLSVCPVLQKNRHEYLGPAGFVQMARHTFDPRDELNREIMALSEGIYNCTSCGRCDTVCPHEIAPSKNIELIRERLIERGNAPRAVNQLIDLVKKTKKAIIPQKGKKSLLEQSNEEHGSKVGLFVGCNFDYDTRLMPIAFAAVKVLQKMGVKLYIPKEQVCCGTPLKEIGAIHEVKELVLENVKAFEAVGCDQILTLCSGCGLSMKKVWPELYKEETGKDLPFTVKDFSEFVVEMGLPEYQKNLEITVTYHDPCSLKRGQGISEEPRQIIQSIPGLKLVEMLTSDECCGAGGGLRMTNFPLSQQITERKVSTVKELGVDAVITGCPTCIKQLTMALSQQRLKNIFVTHPAVLMAQSMGIEI